MSTPLHQLVELGQSVWLDSISRNMLQDGELDRLVRERAIVGVTSNPTIFAQALASSDAYDEDVAAMAAEGLDDRTIFERLAVADIQAACDALRPIWEKTDGVDGRVSIELEPDLADEIEPSTKRALQLWKLVDRPNVMIKVPATEAGLPVIEELTFHGVDVNVTLLFSVDVYRKVMDRYLTGLERRTAVGEPLAVTSVASFFVSRVDTAVDKQLDELGVADLHGKAAVANAAVAWDAYGEVFGSDRFRDLEAAGARPQRPLWASTGTKNAAYSDVLYVQELIVPGTVNTMPMATLEAFADHGESRTTIDDVDRSVLDRLAEVGVDIAAVTEQLRTDGVASFQTSFDELLETIASKRRALASA
jgi:transaldolase